MAQHGMAWHNIVLHGMACMAQRGTAWHGTAWRGAAWSPTPTRVTQDYLDHSFGLFGPFLRNLSGNPTCRVLGAVLQMLHLLLARLLERSHPGALKCNESPQNAMNHPETRTLPSPLSLPAQAVGGRSAGGPTCF